MGASLSGAKRGCAQSRVKAAVFSCAGLKLEETEQRFFAESQPFGFILFGRNCEEPKQVRALVEACRTAVGREDAPVFIDQEGGRVTRLGPPHWRQPPAARVFGTLFERNRQAGISAAETNARLIAAELAALGITVDCAPVLDVPADNGHEIIGDRAFAFDPATVAALGRAVCAGLRAGGVLPVVKHIPGHGRARADSHRDLPVVEATLAELRAVDFAPFAALADAPLAMTAHVLYTALDAERPATTSARVIGDIIRGEIGFKGILISDDIGMNALSGSLAARTEATQAAGCDIVLHCSGVMAEMVEVAYAVGPLGETVAARYDAARRAAAGAASPIDARAERTRLDALFAAEAEA